MILAEQDAALFYRAWGALLTWVNKERRVVPPFPPPTPGHPIDPLLATKVRDVLWADDALRERFLVERATDLAAAERELIASWKHRVRGRFVILNHLKKHTIFMSGAAYCVRGIYTPLEVMFPYVPTYVEAVLIPFRDVIITDGLLQSPPMQLSFGPGARRMFKEEYRAARVAGHVHTQLPSHTAPELELPLAAPPKPTRRKPARRPTRTKPA